MTSVLSHECTRVPVTALAFLGRYLLAAEGVFLRLFDHETAQLLATERVFKSQAIHGISIPDASQSSDLVIVWGGRFVRVAQVTWFETGRPCMNLGPEVTAADWILDVACSPKGPASHLEAALVTAHNGLSLLKVTDEKDRNTAHITCPKYDKQSLSKSFSGSKPHLHHFSSPCDRIELSLNEIVPGSRCILYSAHLRWLSTDRVLVASGTSFGDIVVWSCFLESSNNKTEVHHTFTGHDGSIFGVYISRDLNLPGNYPQRLLASCSDDRTIRIWDISELSQLVGTTASGVADDLLQARETGFRSNSSTTTNDTGSSGHCLAIAWGHASRIWKVRFIHPEATDDSESPLVKLLSVGEDATCQFWDLMPSPVLDGSPKPGGKPFILQHVKTSAYHSGKNMWSYAISKPEAGSRNIATGGADSKIVSQKMSVADPRNSQKSFGQTEWSIDEVFSACETSRRIPSGTDSKGLQSTLFRSQRNGEDDFRSYAFVGKDAFVVTTRSGRVLLAKFASRGYPENPGSPLSWCNLALLGDLRGYSVATGLAEEGIAFFAGSSGTIYCYSRSIEEVFTLSSVKGKVAGLFVQKVDQARLSLVVTRLGGRAPHQLLIDISQGPRPLLVRNLELNLDSGLPPSFVITSVLHNPSLDGKDEELFLGSRNGSVAAVQLPELRKEASIAESHTVVHVSSLTVLHDVHGKEAVTAMRWLTPASDNKDESRWLVSVGRDGTCDIRQRNLDTGFWILVHKLALPFGPNIEGIHVDGPSDTLLVYGFRKKEFVLYDALTAEEIMSIDCGGAHRDWAFLPLGVTSDKHHRGGTLVWTQAQKLHAHAQSGSSHRVIRNGGHGREIKACAVSPRPLRGSSTVGHLIATGAEDTNIRLFTYNDVPSDAASGGFRCFAVIRKHNTGIQNLDWSGCGEFLFSSGGFEEFFVWRVRSVPLIGVGVVCEAVCPTESEVPDLRIMNFDIRQTTRPDGQARGEYNAEFVISMVYSDSTIKVVRYQTLASVGRWTVLQRGNYLSSCLTQVVVLRGHHQPIQVTAGTDGHLALWPPVLNEPTDLNDEAQDDFSETAKCLSRSKIHQNTIKTLTAMPVNNDATLVLTGGDDNALAFTLIRDLTKSASLGEPVLSTLLIPRAHATAITGSAVLLAEMQPGDVRKGIRRFRAVTSSTDQHVKAWAIGVDLGLPGVEGLEVRKSADVFTPVADVSSIAVLPLQDEVGLGVLVCGVGMELWRVTA